jgi:hypothetical protein
MSGARHPYVSQMTTAAKENPAVDVRRMARGARGRNRTGTTAKSRDFLATSAFAAGADAVRGLEHAFTVALRL